MNSLRSFGTVQAPIPANIPFGAVPDAVSLAPVSLFAEDGAPSKGIFYRPKGARPKTGVHLMHPRTDQSQNYNILPLVQAGYAVLGRASRWPNNDVNTVHEHLILDVAAGVRYLREQGCERVVLLGNSGGSAMAAFYQAQARLPMADRLTDTAAGDPLDLTAYDLPPADGVVLVAGHRGEGLLLSSMIDPAVVDEHDPLANDPDLDMYDARNGFRVLPEPSEYSEDFLVRYRQAQLERVRRLDAVARSLIDRQRQAARLARKATGAMAQRLDREATMGWHMIVYRTTALPAFVDLTIEPDDRMVGSYGGGPRPDLENYGDNGFARYITPRAWLSTWSALSSRVRTVDHVASIPDPLLVVHYAGDPGVRLSEIAEIESSAATTDKTVRIVRNADHYGFELLGNGATGERVAAGTTAVVEWMQERFDR